MAEINIQKKRKPIWPWIIIILIVIIAAWFLIKNNGIKNNTDILSDSTTNQQNIVVDTSRSNEIEDFTEFIDDSTNITDAVSYTKEGLEKLSNALGYIINRNDSLQNNQRQMADLNEAIEKIKDSSDNASNAKNVKNAFITSSDLMKSIKNEKYGNTQNQITDISSIAHSININQPLKNQLDIIKKFFKQSNNIIQDLNY